MLTDSKLRSQVDTLWDKFWTGGIANLLSLQEEFAPFATLRGSATGVVARVMDLTPIPSPKGEGHLPPIRDLHMAKNCSLPFRGGLGRGLNRLLESLLSESFGGKDGEK